MPPLSEPKHEAFCLAIVRGESYQAAYESVPGYTATGESARVRAHQLMARPEVAERIRELQLEAVRENRITVDRVLEEYRRIGFSDIRDLMTWGGPGASVILKPSDEITDEAAATIAEVSEEMTATGFKYRIKTHDKLNALKFLAHYLGLDNEGQQTEVEPLHDRVRRLKEQRCRAEALPGTPLQKKIQAKINRDTPEKQPGQSREAKGTQPGGAT